MATRGFKGRRSGSEAKRLPPGQHLTSEFPILTAGTIPRTPLGNWTLAVEDEDGETLASWGWEEFQALGPVVEVRHQRARHDTNNHANRRSDLRRERARRRSTTCSISSRLAGHDRRDPRG